jgi:hypothetical protein
MPLQRTYPARPRRSVGIANPAINRARPSSHTTKRFSDANNWAIETMQNSKYPLALNALEPFLAPVSPEQREQFRLKMAEAFFGRDEGGKEVAGPTNAVQLLRSKETVEAVGDALKIIIGRIK